MTVMSDLQSRHVAVLLRACHLSPVAVTDANREAWIAAFTALDPFSMWMRDSDTDWTDNDVATYEAAITEMERLVDTAKTVTT